MESMATFRTTIISRYTRLFETVTVSKWGHPKRIVPTAEDVESFKNWLIGYIINAEVYDAYAGRISGKDIITNDAFKRQSVPPFNYLYPSLRKALAVLPRENLTAVLGQMFTGAFIKSL